MSLRVIFYSSLTLKFIMEAASSLTPLGPNQALIAGHMISLRQSSGIFMLKSQNFSYWIKFLMARISFFLPGIALVPKASFLEDLVETNFEESGHFHVRFGNSLEHPLPFDPFFLAIDVSRGHVYLTFGLSVGFAQDRKSVV